MKSYPLTGWLAAACAFTLSVACQRPEVLYPQIVNDRQLAGGIAFGVTEIWDSALNEQESGPVDIDTHCTGGQVRISGTLTESAAEKSYELAFEMDNCRVLRPDGNPSLDIKINGTIDHTGSWDKVTEQGQDRLYAESLRILGSSQYHGQNATYDQTCSFEYISTVNAISEAALGEICGRPISFSLSHKEPE